MKRVHGKPFPYCPVRRQYRTGGLVSAPDCIAINIKVDESRVLEALRSMNSALRADFAATPAPTISGTVKVSGDVSLGG